jgi:hypothetical protein
MEKEKGRVSRWAAAGESRWAGRPAGPKGKEGKSLFFLFFFKPFSKHPFKIKFKPNFF